MLVREVCKKKQSKKLCKLGISMEGYHGYLDDCLIERPIIYDFEAYDSYELNILLYPYRNQNNYIISCFGEKPNRLILYGVNGFIDNFSKIAEAKAEMLIRILEELKGKEDLKQV